MSLEFTVLALNWTDEFACHPRKKNHPLYGRQRRPVNTLRCTSWSHRQFQLPEVGEGRAKCRLAFRPLSCTCPCNTSTATKTYCLPDMQQTTERRWSVLKQGFDCKQMFSNMSIDTGIRTVIRISMNINIIVFVKGRNWAVNHNCIFKDLI
jgi:hypothetical protein